jgi:hypothetical protein
MVRGQSTKTARNTRFDKNQKVWYSMKRKKAILTVNTDMVPGWLQEYFPKSGTSLPQWRTNVLIPHVIEREGVCWNKDCWKNVSDVHEGVVTRGDVQGWPNKYRVCVHVPINCVGLCKDCHKFSPSRKDVLLWAVDEYGLWVLDWFEELPFKHSPIAGLITQIRNEYGH